MKGSCLCGAVQYEVQGPFKVFQYCHCSRCRKLTGSVHSANMFVPPAQFQWTKGDSNVGRYRLPGAKYFSTAFCKTCGSTLPWTTNDGSNVVVTAGTLDEDPGIKPQQNIFWGSRGSWCVESSELPKFDELPPRKK